MPPGNIWVIGGKPDWYKGFYIPFKQESTNPYANVRAMLKEVCGNSKISDDFVLMNDDFFAIQKVDDIPIWYTGTLRDTVIRLKELHGRALGYPRILAETNKTLDRLGYKHSLDYELHIPMVMNKEKLSEVLDLRGLWRSLYGNIHKIGGEQHWDVKIYGYKTVDNRYFSNEELLSQPFVSGNENNFHILYKEVLHDMFPEASVNEFAVLI